MCAACGHDPGADGLLFTWGVSSASDLALHSTRWLLQQQARSALACAAPGSDQQQVQQLSSAAAAAAILESDPSAAAAAAAHAAGGAALREARLLLRGAGVAMLPTTLLAWEDDAGEEYDGPDAALDGGPSPCMARHRGLLPPAHERPERLHAVLARLRGAGLLGTLLFMV